MQTKPRPFFFFIANFHSLTTVRNAEQLKYNTYATAATWLAFGFDTDSNVFYRQSDIPEVTELTWYLSCLTPYPMLANAHSFKDKSNRLADVNAGLFTYPVLMAADILLYDTDIVPVGKDQQQHLEITRDIAASINHCYGELFILPQAKIDERVMIIPGTDGQKMSKSYNNSINLFDDEKALKKTVMHIQTDSKAIDEPKDPSTCTVFQLYKLVAPNAEIEHMRNKYIKGSIGYGEAKKHLLGVLIDTFAPQRKAFNQLMQNTGHLDEVLRAGAEKARVVASATLSRVRSTLGVS